MIRNSSYGKYLVTLNASQAGTQEFDLNIPLREYKDHKMEIVVDESVPVPSGGIVIDERLTQHQVLWHLRAQATNVGVTFTSKDGNPLSFDYFEFYRDADHP